MIPIPVIENNISYFSLFSMPDMSQVLRLVRLAKLARGLRVVRMARIMDSLHLLSHGRTGSPGIEMVGKPWDTIGSRRKLHIIYYHRKPKKNGD